MAYVIFRRPYGEYGIWPWGWPILLGRGISVYGSLCNATYFAVRTPSSTLFPFLFQSICITKIRCAHLKVRPTFDRVGRILCSRNSRTSWRTFGMLVFAYGRLD
eukprot:760576-Pleurochrysis_carterae.AAC.1